MSIKIAGSDFPSPGEMKVRHELEDEIEGLGFGSVVDAGSGGGFMDIGVESEDPAKAKTGIDRLMQERHIEGTATVRSPG
ncbi:MAG: hypothetical protein ABI837_14920 [Acidobacteriota bacterium]